MHILTNLYGAPRVNGENFIPASEKNLKSPSDILMKNSFIFYFLSKLDAFPSLWAKLILLSRQLKLEPNIEFLETHF